MLEVTDPGNPHSDLLGKNCDITTDLPKYCVHKDQKTVEKYDVVDEWKNDSVGFVFGCSFTFEVPFHTSMASHNLTFRKHFKEKGSQFDTSMKV